MPIDSSTRELLAAATEALERCAVANARLDAELMMAAALAVSRARLLAEITDISSAGLCTFTDFVVRRCAREPLAYILGRKEFYSLEFEVGPSVLIPRPETELVVERALLFLATIRAPRILDLGAGSGAIALTIAVNAPLAVVLATDISEAALDIARRNAVRLGVASRVEFASGDLWYALDSGARFDLIVSNPPYVRGSELDSLDPEVVRYEPRAALSAGDDGLRFHREICARAKDYLEPGGRLIMEVGEGQANAVCRLAQSYGAARVSIFKDLVGIDRVVEATFA